MSRQSKAQLQLIPGISALETAGYFFRDPNSDVCCYLSQLLWALSKPKEELSTSAVTLIE